MPTIEILAYTPLDMDKFIAFCIDGKPDGKGDYETDDQGRKITGVLRWLHGRKVSEAHFFNSAKGDDLQLFAATVQRLETYDVPWMRRIPGFEIMVTADGLIGKTGTFAPLSQLLATVKSNADLDKKFAEGKAKLDQVLEVMQTEKILPVSQAHLLGTLRGDVGTDTQTVFAEVKEKFGFEL